MRKTTYTVDAECSDCGWSDSRRGAQGRAAQHHDRTGHEVGIALAVVYGRTAPQTEQLPGTERTHIGDPK